MLAAPLPGRHELAAPDTGSLAFGFDFRREIVAGVLAVVERPAFADEPVVDVFAARIANGQEPAVAIASMADGHRQVGRERAWQELGWSGNCAG